MVISEREEHHRPDFDFAVDGDRLIFDSVQAENSGLWKIDNRGTHERTEDTAVTDREGAAGHVLDCELVVASLNVSLLVLYPNGHH